MGAKPRRSAGTKRRVRSATAPTKKSAAARNPLLSPWRAAFQMPPFGAIRPAHFRPAFTRALAESRREIVRIAKAKSRPTFANTIAALEKSGRALTRVSRVFFSLTSADTTPELEAIERELAPKLAAHWSAIMLDPKLFARIDDLFQHRDSLSLDAEQARVLERHHTGFVRSGARLEPREKKRVAEINKRLAVLGTQFAQNILADEQAFKLVLDGEQDLAGLPDFVRAAALRTGSDLGLASKHVVTLARSSIEPFLQFSARRDLREKAFVAWTRRGENPGAHDNRNIAAEIIALRAERATTSRLRARSPNSVSPTPWPKHRPQSAPCSTRSGRLRHDRRRAERDRLQQVVERKDRISRLEAWDWRYYAEKVRKAEYDLDESEIKPYLQLDRIIAAAFDTATRLFGLSFKERTGSAALPPRCARIWEVADKTGTAHRRLPRRLLRPPLEAQRRLDERLPPQQRLRGDIRPIVVNVMNFTRGADGEPALLSFDDARTLFHEFGHALHGLLSDVTYPSIAGTSVSTDFVELPSQLYEHWLQTPEVLKRFAVHFRTGERMPDALGATARSGAQVQPGIRDGRVRVVGARRPGIAFTLVR